MSAKHLARIKSLEHKLKVANKLAALKGGDEALKKENERLAEENAWLAQRLTEAELEIKAAWSQVEDLKTQPVADDAS